MDALRASSKPAAQFPFEQSCVHDQSSYKRALAFKIYYFPSGLGLAKDANILKKTLNELGYECQIIATKPELNWIDKLKEFPSRIIRRFNLFPFYRSIIKICPWKNNTVSIHLETIAFKNLFTSKKNILLPNQELFDRRQFVYMPFIDQVWCKSKLALNIFTELGYNSIYTGFYTELNYQPQYPKKNNSFFTRIGMTPYRGAEKLARIWEKHPEWPTLKMVIPTSMKPAINANNVEFIAPLQNTKDFYLLAESTKFHIYLTEAEGFGHSIVESLSYGAITLITDAAPMNEYADEKSAIMIPADFVGNITLSPRFCSSDSVIEDAIETALRMDNSETEKMLENAALINANLKNSFLDNLKNTIHLL